MYVDSKRLVGKQENGELTCLYITYKRNLCIFKIKYENQIQDQ
jgi:hypothetical protein